MFVRLLFVALAALNIVAAAWLLLGEDRGLTRGAGDPGIPELRLASEPPPAAAR